MVEPTQRPRYFDRQLLGVGDFTLAQTYDMTRRRLHNRLLHTWGIADGLALSFTANASRATVSPGTAYDNTGREIVLVSATLTPTVAAFASKTVFVTIAYAEADTDPRTANGITDNSRTTETPSIQVSDAAPVNPGSQLILGRLMVSATGTITAADEGIVPNRRRLAGGAGGNVLVDQSGLNAGTLTPGLAFGGATSGEGIASKRTPGGNQYGLDFWTGGSVRMSVTNAGRLGLGVSAPGAQLSIAAPGSSELSGTAASTILRSSAGSLGGAGAAELAVASFGFVSSNASSLGIRALRVTAGSDWTTTAIGLGMDVDNTVRINNSAIWLHANGNVGIGTSAPGAKLDISNTGWGQCCAPVPPTLSLSENSAGRGRQAWLQFHNGGEAEAYLRLAGGGPAGSGRDGPRRLEIGDSQGVHTGLTVTGDVSVAGQLNWGGDTSANGSVRIGRLQICWGTGTVTTGAYAGQYSSHVNFPRAFSANPSVNASLNDPGFGATTLLGGPGVWNLTASGFDLLYKYNANRAHTDTFYWIAIGTWW